MADDRDELFEKFSSKIKVLAGKTFLPDTNFHVCRRVRRDGSPNHKATCCQCGCNLYYSDTHPEIQNIQKICADCVLKMDPNEVHTYYGCEHSRDAAIARDILKDFYN